MSEGADGPSRYAIDRERLAALLGDWGEPRYRVDQVWEGLYAKRRPLDQVTTLPKALRARLGDALPEALAPRAELTGDGGDTRKWLWATADGSQVETVLMRYADRATVCVSSQAGCAMGCSFCATGQDGFERHLDVGEIVEQVLRAEHSLGARGGDPDRDDPDGGDPDGGGPGSDVPPTPSARVSNVVFMGMGEPLANEAAVHRSIERLHHDLGISARHITVSTVGVAPAIRRLARHPLPVTLAVSLHAPDDRLRDELVPLNRRYPLRAVLDAAREFLGSRGRRVTFEYVMLGGVNDDPEQAERLGRLLAGDAFGAPAHVNLIPYNPTPGLDAVASPPERLRAFAEQLEREGIGVTIRANRGVDIDAACGQLRRREHSREQQGGPRAGTWIRGVPLRSATMAGSSERGERS